MITVVVARVPSVAPPVGVLRVIVNAKSPTAMRASRSGTLIDWVVTPGANVRLPEVDA